MAHFGLAEITKLFYFKHIDLCLFICPPPALPEKLHKIQFNPVMASDMLSTPLLSKQRW